MGLFGKKKKVRFETITVERERDVFNALEQRGYVLCTDPFQFDMERSHQKLRKDALSMAKDLDAELLVEVWDPIFQHMHWKGLKYAAWRKATPKELEEKRREKEKAERPDYSDSMGSYDDLQRRIDEKQLKVAQEDLRYFDSSVQKEEGQEVSERGGSEDEIGMTSEQMETISSYNPYDHQGEDQDIYGEAHIDKEAAQTGPVFEKNMELDLEAVDTKDPTEDIDPLSMMTESVPSKEQENGETSREDQIPSPGAPPPVPEAKKKEADEEGK
ncbi:MAG: hypothetical protein R6V01_06345 [Thermoplasmatota archaeon]